MKGWVFLCVFALGQTAHGAPVSEYDVKAVFLLNFTRFVEWPAIEATETKPLIVTILGDDRFGTRLEEVFRGEKLGSRPLVLKRTRGIEDALASDVVFVDRSEKNRLREILDGLKSRPVLTVSDIPEFAEQGGMVEFVTENGKIRMNINVDASKSVNLAISAKLLRPAQIVSTRKTSYYHAPALPFSSLPLAAREPTPLRMRD